MNAHTYPVEVLWCANSRGNGWSFHPTVRKKLITVWISASGGVRLERAWLVRTGDSCHVRCLQYFGIVTRPGPVKYFTRGPAMKYNRWLAQPNSLGLEMVGEP